MSDDVYVIGAKIAYWRKRRGKNQTTLAGMAGITQPYLSQIESGVRPVGRRATLVALATALDVSVEELTGQPGDPTAPARAGAAAWVPAIRQSLIMRDLGEIGDEQGDLPEALAARARWDFAGAAPLLPPLISSARGADMVQTIAVAGSVLRHLGYADLARDASRLAVRAARQTEDIAWIGVAERMRVQYLPMDLPATCELARRAADELQPHLTDVRVRRAYGMLHLQAALAAGVRQRRDDAIAHLGEARQVADSVGEPEDWDDLAQNCFGPANVDLWRPVVLAELGDQQEALAAAHGTRPEVIPFRHRQAAWHLDHMLLLAGQRRDDEALAEFLRAETLAPQYVRLNPAATDAVRAIWTRARRAAVSGKLRRAAHMVGLREV